MKITPVQYQAAYQVATEVYLGDRTIGDGASFLHEHHGLNVNSAKDYINDFKYMMKGVVFQRAMSAPAVDYFFSQIGIDFGAEALVLAITSVRKHITYYEDLKNTNLSKLRAVVQDYESKLGFKLDLEHHLSAFEEKVSEAQQDNAEVRRRRLASASTKPQRVAVLSSAFVRNPDVVAEILIRASGECERCKKPAPFKRKKDNSPYLEVHHTKRLADGGEDTVENAQALCPNCHRELHYGG